ncbi:MAG: cytochrome P450 [Firmicutes bacterium]|nr:cytochrome P450 [Alicyclobacillaceae bacterium]MCL6497997.1 cytochrome P450 [Bacillota bacterium]
MAQWVVPSRDNPFDWYRAMRHEAPVHYQSDGNYWEVFSYDHAKTVLSRYQDFSSDFRAFWQRTRQTPPKRALFAESLIRMDPPEHTGLRTMVNPAFNAPSMDRLAPRVEALARTYLAALDPAGFDFVRDFAYPLPVTVISELLGVPASDRQRFKRWVDTLLVFGERDPFRFRQDFFRDPTRQAVREEMEAYFHDFLELRRHTPQDDLMSHLVSQEVEGARLNRDQVFQFCVLLLIAGHVTTTNLLSNAALWLALHPEWFDTLRQGGPEAIRLFVEEVLRYWSPVQRISRFTLHPVVLGGVEIPADVPVVAWIGAANRDPAKFPDPEHFLPTRRPNPHISFGFGPHTCLGAPLARLEATIALDLLLRDWERWEPVESIESPTMQGILYGVPQLLLRGVRRTVH